MQLEKLVTKFSRKSCDLEAIPAIVLKECLHDLIPVITKLVNISITDEVVQSSLKMHLLSLFSKRQIWIKKNLAASVPSQTYLLSRNVLKDVATQLCHHVEDNNLNEVYQSTYKQYHYAETVSIKVQGPVDLYSFIQKSFWINFLCSF